VLRTPFIGGSLFPIVRTSLPRPGQWLVGSYLFGTSLPRPGQWLVGS